MLYGCSVVESSALRGILSGRGIPSESGYTLLYASVIFSILVRRHVSVRKLRVALARILSPVDELLVRKVIGILGGAR